MKAEAILQEVEKRMGGLDEKAKQAVKLALELAQGEFPTKPSQPQWQGENPPFEEMAKLDMMERSKIMWELEGRNKAWLERKCDELKAGWLIVVDGKVYRNGPNMAYGWTDEELLAIAHQTGKLPLIFIHPRLLWIEETAWSVVTVDDAYPTLPIVLQGNSQRLALAADFDTGAVGLFTDYDLVVRQNLVSFTPADQWRLGEHLGQSFLYCPKPMTVVLRADDGTEQTASGVDIYCVFNWQQSPFVSVNPNRTSLVGRDVCLRLKPKVTLDFARRQTGVAF